MKKLYARVLLWIIRPALEQQAAKDAAEWVDLQAARDRLVQAMYGSECDTRARIATVGMDVQADGVASARFEA
jgi:hypothetical protein